MCARLWNEVVGSDVGLVRDAASRHVRVPVGVLRIGNEEEVKLQEDVARVHHR